METTNAALKAAQRDYRKIARDCKARNEEATKEREEAFVAMNPEMDPKKAAQMFCRAQDTKEMMAELPKKSRGSGGLQTLLVPLPKEGVELDWETVTDGLTIETLLLN